MGYREQFTQATSVNESDVQKELSEFPEYKKLYDQSSPEMREIVLQLIRDRVKAEKEKDFLIWLR